MKMAIGGGSVVSAFIMDSIVIKLGKFFVNWSVLFSLIIIFMLSFVRVISRLFFYKHKLD